VCVCVYLSVCVCEFNASSSVLIPHTVEQRWIVRFRGSRVLVFLRLERTHLVVHHIQTDAGASRSPDLQRTLIISVLLPSHRMHNARLTALFCFLQI